MGPAHHLLIHILSYSFENIIYTDIHHKHPVKINNSSWYRCGRIHSEVLPISFRGSQH